MLSKSVPRSWLIISICLLALVTCGIVLARNFRQQNPLFQGKPAIVWARDLNSPDPNLRLRAAEAIKAMGPKAVSPLASALGRRELLPRRIIQKLGIRPPATFKRLYYRLLKPADAALTRADAAGALALIAPEAGAAIPALGRTLQDESPSVSIRAADALAQIGKRAVPTLIKVLQEGDINSRNAATYAIGMIGPEAAEAIPALVNQMKHGPCYDAKQPAYALGRIGPAATATLLQLLRQEDGSLRFLAAYALQVTGRSAKEAVPSLLKVLEDSEAPVRQQALESLVNIAPTDKTVLQAFIRLTQDKDENVRLTALQSLSKVGYATESVVPLLIEKLKDESPLVRRWSVTVLGRMGAAAKPAVSVLREALEDTDEEVRIQAREALKRIEEPPARIVKGR